jgi:zinc protease
MPRHTARSLALGFLVAFSVVLIGQPAWSATVDRVVSAKGITAWLVRDTINPIVTLSFAFRGGAALDPAGKEGLANLAASTMDEGAGDLDSQAFQRLLEDLSISLSFSAGLDNFSGSVRTLKENSETAFNLLRLALTQPRFDSDAVERIRSQILAGLRRNSENPGRIAGRTLLQSLYPNHPYGRPSSGTLETVPRIKLVDLKVFAQQRIARGNLVIGVVGDITIDQLKVLLDRVFGEIPAKASPWEIPEVKAVPTPGTRVVSKSIPQSVIRFGQPGIKRSDDDFYAAYVMNYVLGGGGFESRLYAEVREKRGLAYSAYSYLSPFDRSGLIMGGAGTANARAGETVKVVRDEWSRMANQGLSARELDDAKRYLTGSYALRFSSSRGIASMLVGLQLEDLGIDYFDRRNKLIESISLNEVNRVAKRLLDPKKLTVVVVGEPVGVDTTP